MEKIEIPYSVNVTITFNNGKESKRINKIIFRNTKGDSYYSKADSIDFYYGNDLIQSLEYKKEDGIYKKSSLSFIIAPKSNNRIFLDIRQGNSKDNSDVFYHADTLFLDFRGYLDVLYEVNFNTTKKTLTDAEKEKNEGTLSVIGIIALIVQFICFFIAKFNLKNTYNKEVIGINQIGNMIGADTSVSKATSTTGLGIFAVVMMGICCISFFVLAGLSAKKSTGKYMPLFGVFAVLTIIGGFIVAIY